MHQEPCWSLRNRYVDRLIADGQLDAGVKAFATRLANFYFEAIALTKVNAVQMFSKGEKP
jgi:hypothetical protein